jgi:hypothetical protein
VREGGFFPPSLKRGTPQKKIILYNETLPHEEILILF